MLVRRCWLDLKPRFFWTMGFSLFFVAYFIKDYFKLVKLNNSGALSNIVSKLYFFSDSISYFFTRVLEDYTFYVDAYWFVIGSFIFGLFTIIIALGGIFAHKNKTDLLMTLSLPVKRSNWLMVHAGVTAFLVFILIFGSTISVLFVSHIIGKYYPLDTALAKALFVWLSCLPWIGLSLLVKSLFHSGYKSMMILFIVFVVLCKFQLPGFFHFRSSYASMQQFFAWKEFLVIIITTIGPTGLAIWRFAKSEY